MPVGVGSGACAAVGRGLSGWHSGGVADDGPSGRLAELTVALSLATDLGTGQPMEHGLRTCWLSLRTRRGARVGCGDAVVRVLRGAAAVPRLHLGRRRHRGAGGRRRRGVQRGDGPDADGPARRGDALLRAPPGRGPPGPSPRRAGGAGADRPGHDRAQPVATLRGRRPAWRPGSGWASRCARRWLTPTSAGTARGTRTAWPATRCRSRCGSCRSPGTPSCGNGGPGGRRRSRCWRTGAATATTLRWSTSSSTAVGQWLGDVGDDPCAAVLDAEPAPVATIARGRARRGAGGGGRLHRPEVAVVARPLDRGRRAGGRRRGRGRAARRRRRHARPGGAGARRRARRRAERDLGSSRSAQRRRSGNGSACTRI